MSVCIKCMPNSMSASEVSVQFSKLGIMSAETGNIRLFYGNLLSANGC